MPYRNGNYCAFYVKEPFSINNLGAHATPDFIYYNTLRMWKGENNSFPYVDSHNKTYNVRDGSNWDTTLKPRLHERLSSSKNIILFLSSVTTSSRALDEEMNYGIKIKKLPVIVVYPDFNQKTDIVDNNGNIKKQIRDLWNRLPSFKDNMTSVPTLHIPFNKTLIISALTDPDFMVNTKTTANTFYYPL